MSIFCLFRCRKSGWPVCGPKCEKKIEHNPEVVIPHQTGNKFTEGHNNFCKQNVYHFQRDVLRLRTTKITATFMNVWVP